MTGPILAADIGNSHTVLGILDDGTLVAEWRVATTESRTADEWAVLLRGLLGDRLASVTGIAVCSAVPAVLHEWREMLVRHFAELPHLVVEPGVRTGLPVRTDNPREVGTDRVLNALAAATDLGGPAMVVDFGGTATTFDVVDGSGHFLGGAIAPGIEFSLEPSENAVRNCARSNWPGRPASSPATPSRRSSPEWCTASPARSRDSWGACSRSSTPGRAYAWSPRARWRRLVVDECRSFTHHVPGLTLRGLEIAFRRNR